MKNYIRLEFAKKLLENTIRVMQGFGEWAEVEISKHRGLSIVSMRCNQCGRYAYLVLPKGTKCVYDYCPWCRADMRGDKK